MHDIVARRAVLVIRWPKNSTDKVQYMFTLLYISSVETCWWGGESFDIDLGFRVFATARNKNVLVDLFELGLETLSLDVTSPENVRDVKEDIELRTEGRLDYLVNNAWVDPNICSFSLISLGVFFKKKKQSNELNQTLFFKKMARRGRSKFPQMQVDIVSKSYGCA